jgi:hypothetical protein
LHVVVIFTKKRRGGNSRRDVLLSKRTLIYNELPRIAWEKDQFPSRLFQALHKPSPFV